MIKSINALINTQRLRVIALPMMLCFMLDSVCVLNYTYADSLFLSTYPQSWLLYYYILDPIITAFVFFSACPFLAKASSRGLSLFILVDVLLLAVLYALKSEYAVLPFTLSLALYASVKLMYPIGWNAIATSIDMRLFKDNAFYFISAASIGSILTSFLIPVLIQVFNINFVFYCALLFSIIIGFCLYHLKPLELASSENTLNQNSPNSLLKDNYFRLLFVFTILFVVIGLLAQFSFESSLMGRYSQAGLASFIGIFNGLVSTSCFFIQFFLAKRLLQRVNFIGVLLLFPVICLVMSIALGIVPVVPLFILFNAIQFILGEAFMFPCREMMLNPFPTILRKKANIFIRGYATPIGGLLSAACVYIIQHTHMRFLGFLVIIFSLVLIYVVLKTAKGYKNFLYNSLRENRYAPHLIEYSSDTLIFLRDSLISGLNSPDVVVIKAALSFLEYKEFAQHLEDEKIQDRVFSLMQHRDPEIRYKAVCVCKLVHKQHLPVTLIDLLKKESSPLVSQELLDVLCGLEVLSSSKEALVYLKDNNSYIASYGAIVLDNGLDFSKRLLAEEQLNLWLVGTTEQRIQLARIEYYLQQDDHQNRRLQILLSDSDDNVVITAIQSLKGMALEEALPLLVDCCSRPRQLYYAAQAMSLIPEKAINVLLRGEVSIGSRTFNVLIRLLTQHASFESVEKLINYSLSDSLVSRHMVSVAIENYGLNLRSIEQETKSVRIKLLRFIALEIKTLLKLAKQDDIGVSNEITVQLKINRHTFVMWLSTFVDKTLIEHFKNYLVVPDKYPQNEVVKAFELLDNLVRDHEIKDLILEVSSEYSAQLQITEECGVNPYIVRLARDSFSYQLGVLMNTFDKVCVLRKVRLFNEIPVESLQALAEIAKERDFAEGETVFNMDDESDGFYCIVSGQIVIQHNQHNLANLKEGDYFGELGILDNSNRTSDAIGVSNGLLLYIPKIEFIRLLDDFPEIMRAIVAQIIIYLRSNLDYMPRPSTK